MTDDKNILVRPLSRDSDQALHEIDQCVTIQRAVGWGAEAVPPHVLRADSLGLLTNLVDLGYVLLAQDAVSGEIVGFGRVTYTRDPQKHWLHELAVLPHAQGAGVGQKLMMQIREQSYKAGARVLLLTYDPFDAGNGKLYLNKCGGRGIRAFDNLYGRSAHTGQANRHSHRLMVHWDLTPSRGVESSYEPQQIRLVRSSEEIKQGSPFGVELPWSMTSFAGDGELNVQEETFSILRTAINIMGFEAIKIEKGRCEGSSMLVLVRGSQGSQANAY